MEVNPEINEDNQKVKSKKPRSAEMLPMRVFLEGPITDQMASEFVQLVYARVHQHKEVEIYINSHGGSVYAAMEISKIIMHLSKTHIVSTVGMAMIMSSANDIFMSGEHRYALKSCRFMQHNPMLTAMNNTSDELRHLANELDKDMQWGLIQGTRDTLLTPAQLLTYIEEARNQDFYFDYEFAKEHLIVNRDGLPPITKSKCYSIIGQNDLDD